MQDVETKSLEESFDAILQADRLTGMEARMDAFDEALRKQAERAMALAGRPPLDGAKGSDVDPARAAFTDRYLRRGIEAGVELKSFSGASGGSGGYAVPREIDQMIDAALKSISPIRAVANVVRTGSAGYRKLVTTGGVVSGWAAETAARPETATPTFQEIAPPSGDLYANPSASQAMLDDAQFDVESWLAEEIAREFGRAEGAAFINGDGTSKPKGFLTYATTNQADSVRPFGSLQYVASGAAGGFPASNPQDRLIDLVQSLRAPYRQGAVFVMNAATLATIRKFKTSDGAFLWQPSMIAGQPATLLGYPVIEAEDMPDIAANSLSIAFGNFANGYVIAERSETSILRDPFTNKPFVHFYAVKRIGGAVANSEAIKLMKFAAS
ncbi:HK97 family phage major capsid protein [Sphingobium sp. B2D3A]|uniref:phage major capsid protein n=1 Tax=Sphingobium TaxID=165695 RepID=UPI0015EB83BF|nr:MULTISPECIES: phage major capsid protein [Sphingobium]MCW2338977.1 HK97 family phage major capsid protein [Sphingobium sp. B2D3A]MCW2364281.1 HK97 family phage major capsid protein [Sphingobium sp. B10D3B]MCW2368743.1 HK97 family phage major capsid protein [Sphingobium sp. B11D3D]MCW2385402.1 HK97 family phage major capsid protein [Sphingobium sp. B2D3D]MCW2402322.1 HK97 family phage major capsid protein [Sphingobium sp. B10D7B]